MSDVWQLVHYRDNIVFERSTVAPLYRGSFI
jgi:hypothetical protein